MSFRKKEDSKYMMVLALTWMNAAASSLAVPPISPMRTIPERRRILSNSENNP
jgi:hypothetical protein